MERPASCGRSIQPTVEAARRRRHRVVSFRLRALGHYISVRAAVATGERVYRVSSRPFRIRAALLRRVLAGIRVGVAHDRGVAAPFSGGDLEVEPRGSR